MTGFVPESPIFFQSPIWSIASTYPQFLWGEALPGPIPNILKLQLMRGCQPKLVRGAAAAENLTRLEKAPTVSGHFLWYRVFFFSQSVQASLLSRDSRMILWKCVVCDRILQHLRGQLHALAGAKSQPSRCTSTSASTDSRNSAWGSEHWFSKNPPTAPGTGPNPPTIQILPRMQVLYQIFRRIQFCGLLVPSYCAPLVCVPDVIGVRDLWWQNKPQTTKQVLRSGTVSWVLSVNWMLTRPFVQSRD